MNILQRLALSLVLSVPLAAAAAGIDAISSGDASKGVKEALTRGAEAAVSQLGTAGGFLDNGKRRIPLPPAMQKAEKVMKMMGMQKQADELVTAMNRAAESAVPEAKTLLVDAVKQMSVSDAKAILTGGDDSVTQYFRGKTEATLTKKFLPVVQKSTEKVRLAEKYNALAAKGRHRRAGEKFAQQPARRRQ